MDTPLWISMSFSRGGTVCRRREGGIVAIVEYWPANYGNRSRDVSYRYYKSNEMINKEEGEGRGLKRSKMAGWKEAQT